jgi:hypothetical protein
MFKFFIFFVIDLIHWSITQNNPNDNNNNNNNNNNLKNKGYPQYTTCQVRLLILKDKLKQKQE